MIAYRRDVDPTPQILAIRAAVTFFDRVAANLARLQLIVAFVVRGEIIGVGDLRETFADEVAIIETEHQAQRWVDPKEPTIQVRDRHPNRRMLEDFFESVLGVAERRFKVCLLVAWQRASVSGGVATRLANTGGVPRDSMSGRCIALVCRRQTGQFH